jgi:hypothetical protein
MDPAYIGQRLWLDDPFEAEEHLVSALAGEIHTILEDNNIGSYAGPSAIYAWLGAAQRDGLNLNEQFKIRPPLDESEALDLACEIIEKGWAEVPGHGVSKSQRENSAARQNLGTRTLTQSDELALVADNNFAALLSLKHRNPDHVPVLWLGTVVARDTDGGTEYWLCLQPRCDSIRLSQETAFPFLRLVKSNDRNLINCLVQDGGTTEVFKISRRIRDLEMVKFSPDDGEVRGKKTGDNYYFGEIELGQYRWVGELKPQHAQRVANQFAAEASRVEVAESEWLRTHGGN